MYSRFIIVHVKLCIVCGYLLWQVEGFGKNVLLLKIVVFRLKHTHTHLISLYFLFVLQEEFGYNAETQKLLAKNGETLLGAINFFISSVKTLVDKTIEDTLINIKQYEAARWDTMYTITVYTTVYFWGKYLAN